MNNDLISREETMDVIKSLQITLGGENIFRPEAKASVLECLDFVPKVDAEPVRHGWWIPKTHIDGEVTHECSYCGEEAIYYDNHQGGITSEPTDYCPYCGTKMDLGDIG